MTGEIWRLIPSRLKGTVRDLSWRFENVGQIDMLGSKTMQVISCRRNSKIFRWISGCLLAIASAALLFIPNEYVIVTVLVMLVAGIVGFEFYGKTAFTREWRDAKNEASGTNVRASEDAAGDDDPFQNRGVIKGPDITMEHLRVLIGRNLVSDKMSSDRAMMLLMKIEGMNSSNAFTDEIAHKILDEINGVG